MHYCFGFNLLTKISSELIVLNREFLPGLQSLKNRTYEEWTCRTFYSTSIPHLRFQNLNNLFQIISLVFTVNLYMVLELILIFCFGCNLSCAKYLNLLSKLCIQNCEVSDLSVRENKIRISTSSVI